MKNAQQIFEGISDAELLSYLVNGDNSKELKSEINRRGVNQIKSRVGKINNIQLDAQFSGQKQIVLV